MLDMPVYRQKGWDSASSFTFDLSFSEGTSYLMNVHLSCSRLKFHFLLSLSLSLPRLQNMLSLLQQLNGKFSLCSLILNNFSFVFSPSSWTYGSNSLPTAGSVSGGVARRGQRQFQMTPRGLPAGRMGLLSPSGIGGASPRHTLTSPALAAQGRQVSIQVSVTFLISFSWISFIILNLYCLYAWLCVDKKFRKKDFTS